LAAGCGSDSDSADTSASTSAATSTVAAADSGSKTGASQALLDKYSQEPQFVPPGPDYDAKKELAGKKIMSIPVTSQVPITNVLEDAQAKQAKRIGVKFTHWQNQGKPDQWIQGIETAISQKYDVIELVAIDPAKVKPQIDKARKAGIKVVVNHYAGFGWEPPSYVEGGVRLPYYEAGRILAAWSIVDTDGKANVLSIISDDQISTKDMVKGMQDEYAENCSDCKLKTVNVPTVDWAQGTQNEVRAGLQRDPTVNYVIPIYDAMSQYAASAVQASGKSGSVKLATFNGTPFALELVDQGKLAMNLGENEDWIARAMLDASMRAAAGMEVPEDDYKAAPLLIFTKDNVAQAGTPPDPSKGYGDAYEAGFDKMWGLGS
jgi:ribose transport system substrate-binding protein